MQCTETGMRRNGAGSGITGLCGAWDGWCNMQRKVCHHCPDRQPEGTCRKTCERWQEEQRQWDAEMEKRKAFSKGLYFSQNAVKACDKRRKGH